MTVNQATKAFLWSSVLRDSLALGYADRTLFQHIDEILQWYSTSLTDDADNLAASLIGEYGLSSYKIRFESFLDRLLISGGSGRHGPFEPHLDRSKAKWRYRKLISIFHPDKGANEVPWLNFRAEKINKYYADFKRDDFEQKSSTSRTSSNLAPGRRRQRVKAKKVVRASNSSSKSFKVRKNWRERAGNPEVLEERIIKSVVIILIVLGLLFATSLYLVP